MEQFALYLILKNIIKDIDIDNKYTISFNDMDFNKPYSLGIYVKGGEVSQYRQLGTGQYLNYVNRVQLIIQGDRSNEGLADTLRIASKIRNTFVILNNKNIDVPENSFFEGQTLQIQLGLVKLLGEVNFNNKTAQGLPVYSINFKFNYFLKEVINNG